LPALAVKEEVIMSMRKQSPAKNQNRLLSALPQKEYKRLLAKMEEVFIEQGQRLIVPGEQIKDVYFPLNAMVSMVSSTEEGISVETGIAGSDGMLGISILFGTTTTPMESVVQIPGKAMRMGAKEFKSEFDRGGVFNKTLLLYLHILVIEISQTAACNKLHRIDGRLARWLLMCSDSIGSDELPLTHEFLSTMLGARRAGVTEASGRLRKKGAIRYHHGRITILDRKGLEDEACECYEVVRREYSRLFPLIWA
jgi:CRP-like cAMP-binding protein